MCIRTWTMGTRSLDMFHKADPCVLTKVVSSLTIFVNSRSLRFFSVFCAVVNMLYYQVVRSNLVLSYNSGTVLACFPIERLWKKNRL